MIKWPNRFTEAYGIDYPIAAAGMAFVTLSPALPIAVCAAGAIGGFGAGILPVEVLRATIRQIRHATSRPFHLNLITMLATDEHVGLCVEEHPDIVSFHWQHPSRIWIDRLQQAGIRVWEQIGTPDDARRALDDGIDLVIAQGSEAGGHCYGRLPVSVLVPAVVDAVDGALVLAAGGISDGRGLAAALALGADGAMIGTRLVATVEAEAAEEYKERLVASGPLDTILTDMFGRDTPEFNPMRVLRNGLVDAWHIRSDDVPVSTDQPEIGAMQVLAKPIALRRFASIPPVRGATGDFDQMALLAGQGVGSVRKISSAHDVITDMATQARSILHGLR